MEVDIKTKAVVKIDIKEDEAFELFLKTLGMEFIFDEKDFVVKKDEYDEYRVYVIENGKEVYFDDRGGLFIALRNVATNMYPNLHFRSESYIYS